MAVKVEEDFAVLVPALDEATADTITTRLMVVPSRVTITAPSGAGVEWRTDLEDYRTLLKVVRILAGLKISRGDRVTVAATGEGDVPRVVVDEIRRALAERPPEAEEMIGSTFLRFTPPPLSGESKNHQTGEVHDGVSVFRGRWLESDIFEIDTNKMHPATVAALAVFLRCAAPAFFVTGAVVGRGPGNESLVNVARFWRVPREVGLTVTPVGNSHPDISDQRIANLAKRWNRADHAEKRGGAYFLRKAAYAESLLLKPAFAKPSVSVQAVKPFNVDALADKLLREWKSEKSRPLRG